MNKPYFIALEGIEGVGKTTLSHHIAEYLAKKSLPSHLTREPGGTPLAEKIRGLLKNSDDDIDIRTELLLMFAARSHHVATVIQAKLAAGISVISDRYVDASYAYQGGGRGIDDGTIEALEQIACQGIRPHFTVLVVCDPLLAMQRVQSRGKKDRFEQEDIEFFQRVQDRYLLRAKHNSSYIILDGSQSLSLVIEQLNVQLRDRI